MYGVILARVLVQALWRAHFSQQGLQMPAEFAWTSLGSISEGFVPHDIVQVHKATSASVSFGHITTFAYQLERASLAAAAYNLPVQCAQVVNNIAGAHSKGSSVKLVSMDEVCRWLPSVKQQHADDVAALTEWYTSHINWISPDPATLVRAQSACQRQRPIQLWLDAMSRNSTTFIFLNALCRRRPQMTARTRAP
jgi:hypothetical protein